MVWDVDNRKQLCKIEAGNVFAIAVAPDGETVASVGNDAIIRLWDLSTQQEKARMTDRRREKEVTGQCTGHTLFFTPDGKRLLSAGVDAVRIWKVAGGQEDGRIAAGRGMTCYALSPGGTMLASGGSHVIENTAQASLVLWDVATGQELRRLQGHKHFVEAVAFSPDGKELASAEPGTIHLWDVATGKELHGIEHPGHRNQSLAFSADTKILAAITLGGDTLIHLWDVATGKPLQPDSVGGIRALAFSPDGRIVATPTWGGPDSSIRLWDAATGKLLRQCQGHEAAIDKVLFTPDGKQLISGGIDGTLRLWDVQTGKEIRKYPIPEGRYHNVPGLALSRDGKRLISIHSLGENEQAVIVWDVQTGEAPRPAARESTGFFPKLCAVLRRQRGCGRQVAGRGAGCFPY